MPPLRYLRETPRREFRFGCRDVVARSVVLTLLLIHLACCGGRERVGLGPGENAPDFELPDLGGVSRKLSDYEGKVVLLNFWASWCQPCLAELPSLEALRQDFDRERFEIISLAVNDRADNVSGVQRKYALSFPILLDLTEKVKQRYHVTGFPETFLLDARGRLVLVPDPRDQLPVVRIVGPRSWDSEETRRMIERLVDQSRAG